MVIFHVFVYTRGDLLTCWPMSQILELLNVLRLWSSFLSGVFADVAGFPASAICCPSKSPGEWAVAMYLLREISRARLQANVSRGCSSLIFFSSSKNRIPWGKLTEGCGKPMVWRLGLWKWSIQMVGFPISTSDCWLEGSPKVQLMTWQSIARISGRWFQVAFDFQHFERP